jgi:hypothetical protein
MVQGIGDVDLIAIIHRHMRRKIEFARPAAALAELGNKFAVQSANHDLVKLRVGDDQPVAQKRQPGRALQFVGDGKLHFAFFIKGDHFAQGGVGHKKSLARNAPPPPAKKIFVRQPTSSAAIFSGPDRDSKPRWRRCR